MPAATDPSLGNLISVDRIRTGLAREDRDSVIRELLSALVQGGGLEAGRVEAALEQIAKREKIGSTAIGGGVAIPHARVDFVSAPVVAYALLREGTDFRPLDGEAVRHVFLLLTPSDVDEAHIAVLRRITGFARKEVHLKALSGCPDPEAVAGVFRDYD